MANGNPFLESIFTPSVGIAIVFIFATFGLACWQLRKERIRIAAVLDEFCKKTIPSMRSSVDESGKDSLSRAFHRILQTNKAEFRGRSDLLVVSEEPVEYIRTELVEEMANSWSVRLGESLSALGLFFTFLLIALAVPEISHGLLAVAGEGQGNTGAGIKEIANAIKMLGGKFVVSCSGIALSVAFGFVMDSEKRALENAVDGDPAKRIRDACVSQSAKDMEIQEYHLSVQQEQFSQLCQLGSATAPLTTRIDGLEQTISSAADTLIMKLGQQMSGEIGRQIRTLLDEQRESMQRIADGMANAVASGVSNQLEQMTSKINEVLDRFQSASSGNVEKLMQEVSKDIQRAVREAMGGSSADMNKSLADFRAVIPELSKTLSSMVSNIERAQNRSEKERSGLHEETQAQIKKLALGLDKVNGELFTGLAVALKDVQALVSESAKTSAREVDERVREIRDQFAELTV